MRLGTILLIGRNELRLAIRSKAFLITCVALLILITLDVLALVGGGAANGSGNGYTNELISKVALDYMIPAVPLLALIISAPSFSFERQRGTMRFVLSQDITSIEYLIGKLLGVLAAVVLPLVLAISVHFVLGLLFTGVPLSLSLVSIVLVTMMNVTIVGAVYGSLGALASVIGKTPVKSMMLAACLYLFLGSLYYLIAFLMTYIALGINPGLGISGLSSRIQDFIRLVSILISGAPQGMLILLQASLSPFTGSAARVVGLDYLSSTWTYYVGLLGYFFASNVLTVLFFSRSEK